MSAPRTTAQQIETRFRESFDVTDPPKHRPELGPCWQWKRRLDHGGYPQFSIGHSRRVQAHRWAYKLHVGPIPRGLDLDHLCRNRACVNHSHLQPVTRRENLLRGATITAANSAKMSCSRGHYFTAENTYKWRNVRQCRECRAMHSRNRKRREPSASESIAS